LELEFVTQTQDMKAGDHLVSSGMGQIYPKNYPVGEIISVTQDPGQPFISVRVRPLAEIESTRHVILVFESTETVIPDIGILDAMDTEAENDELPPAEAQAEEIQPDDNQLESRIIPCFHGGQGGGKKMKLSQRFGVVARIVIDDPIPVQEDGHLGGAGSGRICCHHVSGNGGSRRRFQWNFEQMDSLIIHSAQNQTTALVRTYLFDGQVDHGNNAFANQFVCFVTFGELSGGLEHAQRTEIDVEHKGGPPRVFQGLCREDVSYADITTPKNGRINGSLGFHPQGCFGHSMAGK